MTLGTAAQLRSVAAVTTVDVAGSLLPVKSEMKSLGVIIDSHTYASTSTPQP